ncbi:Protein of unknown function [Gryllus bimaculatus]|nr:Protein of unknown function [Gryllus bimaculatus]
MIVLEKFEIDYDSYNRVCIAGQRVTGRITFFASTTNYIRVKIGGFCCSRHFMNVSSDVVVGTVPLGNHGQAIFSADPVLTVRVRQAPPFAGATGTSYVPIVNPQSSETPPYSVPEEHPPVPFNEPIVPTAPPLGLETSEMPPVWRPEEQPPPSFYEAIAAPCPPTQETFDTGPPTYEEYLRMKEQTRNEDVEGTREEEVQ